MRILLRVWKVCAISRSRCSIVFIEITLFYSYSTSIFTLGMQVCSICLIPPGKLLSSSLFQQRGGGLVNGSPKTGGMQSMRILLRVCYVCARSRSRFSTVFIKFDLFYSSSTRIFTLGMQVCSICPINPPGILLFSPNFQLRGGPGVDRDFHLFIKTAKFLS